MDDYSSLPIHHRCFHLHLAVFSTAITTPPSTISISIHRPTPFPFPIGNSRLHSLIGVYRLTLSLSLPLQSTLTNTSVQAIHEQKTGKNFSYKNWLKMEATVKKFQQKFRKVKDEMDKWDDLQNRLVSQFRNASSIIARLQLLEDSKNYGSLKNLDYIKNAILTKQIESLQKILLSITKTLEELNNVVLFLAKTSRDAKQQVKGGSVQLSKKQLHHRIGIKPSIADCLEGLRLLHEMYQSEYMLKSSITSALSSLALKPSVGDLQAFERLLVDQPNIPKEEVQSIYDVIFSEEIC